MESNALRYFLNMSMAWLFVLIQEVLANVKALPHQKVYWINLRLKEK